MRTKTLSSHHPADYCNEWKLVANWWNVPLSPSDLQTLPKNVVRKVTRPKAPVETDVHMHAAQLCLSDPSVYFEMQPNGGFGFLGPVLMSPPEQLHVEIQRHSEAFRWTRLGAEPPPQLGTFLAARPTFRVMIYSVLIVERRIWITWRVGWNLVDHLRRKGQIKEGEGSFKRNLRATVRAPLLLSSHLSQLETARGFLLVRGVTHDAATASCLAPQFNSDSRPLCLWKTPIGPPTLVLFKTGSARIQRWAQTDPHKETAS